jgi:hypothetical protein
MTKLLFLQGSPRKGASQSVQVAQAYLDALCGINPDLKVDTIELPASKSGVGMARRRRLGRPGATTSPPVADSPSRRPTARSHGIVREECRPRAATWWITTNNDQTCCRNIAFNRGANIRWYRRSSITHDLLGPLSCTL